MSALITPTPGRVVWYWPSQHELDAKSIAVVDQSQPLAATVAYVHSDRLVNLSVVDQAGAQFRRTSVKLLQEDDATPHTSEGPYATWMPYQIGQAEKSAPCGGEWGSCGATPPADVAEVKTYEDGTTATGTAPLPGQSPVAQVMADAKRLADAVAGLPDIKYEPGQEPTPSGTAEPEPGQAPT